MIKNERSYFKSPLGFVVLSANSQAVLGLEFSRFEPAFESDNNNVVLLQATVELKEYFAGKRKNFSFPFELKGTDFQVAVWHELLKIPCGGTLSYLDIAKKIGKAGGARAIGQAVGANPLLLVVPCHRVITRGGKLGGFSSGVDRKDWLLRHEQSHFGLEQGFGLSP